MSTREHSAELLGAYVLGALDDDAERRALEEHLASCGQCREEVDALREMETALGEVPPEAFIDGPPEGGDLLLQRTLRQARGERSTRQRRRRALGGLAVAASAAAVFFGGFLAGGGPGTQDVAGPPPTGDGVLVARGTDAATGASMTVTVTPATEWVRVNTAVSGLPPGERCRVVVIAADGTEEIAGSWVVPEGDGWGTGVSLDGFAAVGAEDIDAIAVENEAGERFVTATL